MKLPALTGLIEELALERIAADELDESAAALWRERNYTAAQTASLEGDRCRARIVQLELALASRKERP